MFIHTPSLAFREKLCFYRSILLHSTLGWTKRNLFFYQWTNKGRHSVFYDLLIMHFDLAFHMWRVRLWRRSGQQDMCLSMKSSVQWIVHIEIARHIYIYMRQCSFYIILWSIIQVEWWTLINCKVSPFCAHSKLDS